MIALMFSSRSLFLSSSSGQAAYNPNFEEIKGDWRERIRARGAKSGYPTENTWSLTLTNKLVAERR